MADMVAEEQRLAGLAIDEGIRNMVQMANCGASYSELRRAFLATAAAGGLRK